MYRRSKLLLTQSLLSSWLYQYTAYDSERAREDFVRALKREPAPQSKAMRDGIQFENMVTACCDGVNPDPGHEWEMVVRETAEILRGAQFQVTAYQDKRIDGVPFLLYGRLDALKAGVIYDTKFSRSYQSGKYVGSPQHPIYFECVPEARKFVYIIADGKAVYLEEYRREDTPPPDGIIRQFMAYLETAGLAQVYIDNWKTN